MRNKTFIQQRKMSFIYAFRGIALLLKTETHFIIHAINTIIAIAVFSLIGISAIEWMIVSIVITMVLVAEGLNTAIELLADKVEPQFCELIGKVKDISAGASLLASINAVIVGGIILGRNTNIL